ncbi:MAG: lipopolysaccharide assembly protein LapB [Methylophaga sp.]|nr:lipopolysaccharide assembly protein LapB [Methylophaga sp.]
MLEWLFFLLPVAAMSGWFAARRHYKKRRRHNDTPFNPDYFRGLNYLLNEQPDKAIDVFIGLLEVNSETVETHLALANLFRRRGETDRAIRIHQNLIARPTLSSSERTHALLELGMDYMHAGVLDRAEHIFLELLQHSSVPYQAPEQLLRIYQQQKNWARAIEMAEKIPGNRRKQVGTLIAQFYCELAEKNAEKDRHGSLAMLKQALYHDEACVRASILTARIHLASGHPRKALKNLLMVEKQNPAFLSEALPLLLECHEQLESIDAFQNWLRQLLQRHPHLTSARLMLAKLIERSQGRNSAQEYLYQELHQYPSVEGLYQLMRLDENNSPALIPLIQKITDNMISRGDRYTCKNCGFSGKTLHWHCPGCGKWATVRPTEVHLSALEKLLDRTT